MQGEMYATAKHRNPITNIFTSNKIEKLNGVQVTDTVDRKIVLINKILKIMTNSLLIPVINKHYIRIQVSSLYYFDASNYEYTASIIKMPDA